MPLIKNPDTGLYEDNSVVPEVDAWIPEEITPVETQAPQFEEVGWWEKFLTGERGGEAELRHKAQEWKERGGWLGPIKGIGKHEAWKDPKSAAFRLMQAPANIVMPDNIADFINLGSHDAVTGIVKTFADLGEGDYESKGFGWLDENREKWYKAGGNKPPSEWTEGERAGAEIRSDVVLNAGMLAAIYFTGGAVLKTPAGVAFLAKYPWIAKSLTALDPKKATTLRGLAGRLWAQEGLEEGLVGRFQENQGGSAASFLNLIPGVENADPVKPGMTRWEAANAAWLPNTLMAGGFVSLLNAGDIHKIFKNKARSLKSNGLFNRRNKTRDNQVQRGLITKQDDGTFAANPALTEKTGTETAAGAEAILRKKAGLSPKTMETDAFEEGIESVATNKQIQEIAERQDAGEDVTVVAEEVLSRAPEKATKLQVELTAETSPEVIEKLYDLDLEDLREVVKENPGLWGTISGISGKDISEFDRVDITKGIEDYIPRLKADADRAPIKFDRTPTAAEQDPESFEEWLKNPPDEYKEIFKEIDDLNLEAEEAIARSKEIFNNLDKNIGALDELSDDLAAESAELYYDLSPKDQKVVDLELNLKGIERQGTIDKIITKGIKDGQLRAPSTILPVTPEAKDINVDKVVDDLNKGEFTEDVLDAIDDELRLGEEFGKLDEAIEADVKAAERAAEGYEDLTFGEKKEKGGELTNMLRGALRELAQSDARSLRGIESALAKSKSVDSPEAMASYLKTQAKLRKKQLTGIDLELLDSSNFNELPLSAKRGHIQEHIADLEAEVIRRKVELDKMSMRLNAKYHPGEINPSTDNWPKKDREAWNKGTQARWDLSQKRQSFLEQALREDYRTGGQSRFYNDEISLGGEWEAVDVKPLKDDGDTLAGGLKRAIEAKNAVDQKLARRIGEHIDFQSKGLKDLQDMTPVQDFAIPRKSGIMTPRYGMATIKFGSDLDKVAYIVRAGKSGPMPKSAPTIKKLIKDAGYDYEEVRKHGAKVHASIKKQMKDKTGSASAGPDNSYGVELDLPDQGFAPGGGGINAQISQSNIFDPDHDFTGGTYNQKLVRNELELIAKARRRNEAIDLLDYGQRIKEDYVDILSQSDELGREAADAIRDAAIISGIPAERINWIDDIDMVDIWGAEATAGSISQWRPDHAQYLLKNPGDPLAKVAAGQTGGFQVSAEYPSDLANSIFLALHPAINRRLGGLVSGVEEGGKPLGHVAYHEAFHAVQQWLDRLGQTKLIDALNSPEALDEMTRIIKKQKGSAYSEGMAPVETQAEAFAVWLNNRKVKLKSGGVKAAFERMKMFLNSVRTKIRKIMGKDPTFVDVFELAASGKIARKGLLDKMTPAQLDAMTIKMNKDLHRRIPELSWRIQEHLVEKRLVYDELLQKIVDKVDLEGCN